jgi:hypothetical protein
MMSPQTPVVLTLARDRETAWKAAHRPDALPDPVERPAEAVAPGRVRRRLERLHLSPPRHA